MTKRTIGIVLAALAGMAAVGAVLYFTLHDRFAAPPPPEEAKNDPGDKGAPTDESDDPSLYTPAPVSLAAIPGKSFLQRRRAAVLLGRVLTPDGQGMAKAIVRAPGQSSAGQALTDDGGGFELAVNGGGPLVVTYEKTGFLPARRSVAVPWQDYVWLPDVVLVPAPAPVGVLELPWREGDGGAAPAAPALGHGLETMPQRGTRKATFIAPAGFTAGAAFGGGVGPLKGNLSLSVREYAGGPNPTAALPAPPPPGTSCAYAVEVAADLTHQPGARGVVFTPSLIHYVDNSLQLPVGTALPTWRYDAEQSAWLPGAVGGVVRAADLAKGLDEKAEGTEGDKTEEPAAGDGPGRAERKTVGKLFANDQTLWRLPLTATGTWAVFFPLRPPEGAVAPPGGLASVPADAARPASESVPIPGTPFQLYYSSDRAPGWKAPYQIDVTLCGPDAPKGLKRIDLEIQVAGQRFQGSFPPNANQTTAFHWNGLDAHGRPIAGRRPATVRVGYAYDAPPPAALTPPSPPSDGGKGSGQECELWREQRLMVGGWDARAEALGGWTLNVHHAYDPIGRVLYLGGGGRRDAMRMPPVITTVAGGTGVPDYNDDDQPAVQANLNEPRGLAVGPDGSLYIADARQDRVRRVKPDGLIATAAGTTLAPLNGPTGLAVGPDGGLYVADDGAGRVWRQHGRELQPFVGGLGSVWQFDREAVPAGQAKLGHLRGLTVGPAGDLFLTQNYNNQCACRVGANGIITFFLGGPNDRTKLLSAVDVVAAADGTVYVVDGDGCRVWRVGPDGTATVAAGTGTRGFSGDGGPAVAAQLNKPSGVALGPDGSLYIADARNERIRRVAPDGVISTFAGGGKSGSRETGDGGPASAAELALYLAPKRDDVCGLVGLAVSPGGGLYVADVGHGSVRRIAPAFDGISDSEILITSEDGQELYVFDGVGRHLETLDAATGALIYRFVYDAAWRLKEVHDGSGAVTRVERKAGRPVALIAPGGERTTLETGADSRLSRVALPTGQSTAMEYDAGGLLTSFKDAPAH